MRRLGIVISVVLMLLGAGADGAGETWQHGARIRHRTQAGDGATV